MLTEQQHRDLTEGKPVKVEDMLSRGGKPFDATLQVNAEKRGIEFIFNDNLSFKERRQLSGLFIPNHSCDPVHSSLLSVQILQALYMDSD
ncbi:hypothetical protein PGIN_3A1_01381 [Porphyromonas gingivalis]|nr:hypothetical protein PGIN_3A1_01381 [Porphyromonas gingivalis]